MVKVKKTQICIFIQCKKLLKLIFLEMKVTRSSKDALKYRIDDVQKNLF